MLWILSGKYFVAQCVQPAAVTAMERGDWVCYCIPQSVYYIYMFTATVLILPMGHWREMGIWSQAGSCLDQLVFDGNRDQGLQDCLYVALDALFSVRNEPKGLNSKGWEPGITVALAGHS